MSNLDLILKNMILSEPHIYPTTWQCYATIFLDVNSGFTFEDFKIQAPFDIIEQPVINEDYLKLYKARAVTPVTELDHDMKAFMHEFIKENIDTIVKTKCVYVEYLKPSITDLEMLLDCSPVWFIDESYPVDVVKAAIDVLKEMKHLLWHHHGLHHSPYRPIDREAWREMCYYADYLKVTKQLEKIERMPA